MQTPEHSLACGNIAYDSETAPNLICPDGLDPMTLGSLSNSRFSCMARAGYYRYLASRGPSPLTFPQRLAVKTPLSSASVE